jgi:pilus assembly protein Flp/PilA
MQGQGLLEYGLIIMLVALIIVIVLTILGPSISNLFSNVVGNI